MTLKGIVVSGKGGMIIRERAYNLVDPFPESKSEVVFGPG
eukprot:CAMPEP_0196819382 /NCGR_PEP_ID=MMETSP1362-20130617/70312_1 /TAXON_ID=163516 /ORGANISM="Leptocylindrus danicus, Strain CCMP1856" /LENGTH=39 /DNA_ID= /DNA_START= /DNA_END= /DNA_ORIENTATION=